MKLEYIKVVKQDKGPFVCPHNQACRCQVKNCYNCGWNPKVAQIRSEKILRQRKEVMSHG